jgi:gliding motility-associated-like protein
MEKRVVIFLFTCCLNFYLSAQVYEIPSEIENNLIYIDVDNDNDLDIFSFSNYSCIEEIYGFDECGNESIIGQMCSFPESTFSFYENTSQNGILSYSNEIILDYLDNNFVYFPSLVDLDSDQDLDVLIRVQETNCYEVEGDSHFKLLINNGNSQQIDFVPFSLNDLFTMNVNLYYEPIIMDIGNDGDFDFFINGTDGLYFIENIGTAQFFNFAAPVVNPLNLTTNGLLKNLVLVDLDDDSDFDFVASSSDSIYFYENSTSNQSPLFLPAIANPFNFQNTKNLSRIFFKDADNDNDLDCFLLSDTIGIVQSNLNLQPINLIKYYENTSGANVNFEGPIYNPFCLTSQYLFNEIQCGDLENDGDLDIFTSSYYAKFYSDCWGGVYFQHFFELKDSVFMYFDADGDFVAGNSQAVFLTHCAPNFSPITGDVNEGNSNLWRVASFYLDEDRDGIGGDAFVTVEMGAEVPVGYSTFSGDCNDQDSSVIYSIDYFFDADQDGYGGSMITTFCIPPDSIPSGFSINSMDCNDNDSTVWFFGGVYLDNDLDGYGTGDLLTMCLGSVIPSGFSETFLDCDDNDPNSGQAISWYLDYDNDGFGYETITIGSCGTPDESNVIVSCVQPLGYVNNNLDCKDSVSTTNPNVTDIPNNGIDEDCSGSDETAIFDNDSDGETNETDCNDNNPQISTNSVELCDGIDNNCNGLIDENVALIQPQFNFQTNYCVQDQPIPLPSVSQNGISGQWNQEISTNQAGAFDCIFTANPNQCASNSNVQIVVHDLPIVDAGNDTIICPSDGIVLIASGALTYNWSNGNTNGQLTNPTISTTFSVIGSDSFGCQNSDQIFVEILDTLVVEAGEDQIICFGDEIILSAQGNALSFSWDNDIINQQSFIPVETKTYNVIGNYGSCQETDNLQVVVNPLPKIDAGKDLTICSGDEITLQAEGGISYIWDYGVLDNEPFIPMNPLTYTVIGIDTNNCKNIDKVDVIFYSVCPEDLIPYIIIPNIFTPNDDGTNSTWKINTKNIKEIHVNIYNRWGSLVKSLSTENDFWDGVINGNEASEGTYFFTYLIVDLLNNTITGEGTITLIR